MSSRIQVQLRKGSVTVVPESIIRQGVDAREAGENVQVAVHPRAVLVVYPDGSSVADIGRLIDAAEAKVS